MKKSMIVAYLLAIGLPLGMQPNLSAGTAISNFVLKKVSTGVKAGAGAALRILSGMEELSLSKISSFLSALPSLQEDEYDVVKPVTSIKISNGGVLLISKGDKNSLSRITLPQNLDKVLLGYNKDCLELGVKPLGWFGSQEEFNRHSATTIFRLTYVDRLPNITVDGKVFVHIAQGTSDGKCVLKLKNNAVCSGSAFNLGEAVISQGEGCKLALNGLKAKALHLTVKKSTSTTISGLNVSGHAGVEITGAADDKVATVRLQGKAPSMKLGLGAYAVFDGSTCDVKNMQVQTNCNFTSAVVNVADFLEINGSKSSGSFECSRVPAQTRDNVGLSIKQSGMPPVLSGILGKVAHHVEKQVDSYARRHKAREHQALGTSAEAMLDPLVD